MLQYMAMAMGQNREKVRAQFIDKMIRPVGPPPEVERD
jgi:splicing factor 3B subunit 5